MKRSIMSLVLIIYTALALTGCSKYSDQQVSLRDQGIEAMDSGDYDSAIELFNQALSLSNGTVTDLEIDIDYYKAAAQYQAKYYEDALSTYTALIRYDSKNSDAYFLRGCIYANTEEINNACDDFDSAIEVAPKNYALYVEIYENLSALGYTDQATDYINQLFELSDKSAEAKYYKGRGYYLTGDAASAEEYLKAAVEKNITEAKLYLAKLYQDQGNVDQAKELLEEYANSDGVNAEAMAALGDIELTKGNYEDALEYYETGLTLDSSGSLQELYKGQVVALENLGRFSEAKEILTQYLDIYPNDEEAQRELIFLKTR